MGYITNFTLDIINVNYDEKYSVIQQFREDCDNAEFAIDENGDCINSTKWYDHRDDLIQFSLKHPNMLFLLEGEGEDTGDVWKLYVKNGKSQLCEAIITFDDFDEKRLV